MGIKKGDLYFADLSPVTGSEQGGIRPVLVVQNDVGNKFSPTIIVAAITSRRNKADLPTHVEIEADGNGLSKNSVVLLEQLRTIDKRRLRERIGTIDKTRLPEVDEALSVSLGIENNSFF
ncbi:MAG: type II toxin-antitoxin system PemK/MazF family toxin [Firmicutes bacterium]|nr:type II toxin-antitoxin system PemK/MazF family toxin [Bacillota bacterium]MBQ3185682.1 type II toxin-antitoxin system PemK/MazF family toxin [Bacillota bacterium]MBQ3610964.1 type II toxin-antitoxin system PemK/MazF family toxin [Bacillota bacterium]MBR1993838.1 type II toxin-antitoxin system PemK/MazF family toxin [Bacillota bacterium]MBR2620001.1 type II toxin-antitoxin system PemK/MazF family toxin [Bacillota bacterium]